MLSPAALVKKSKPSLAAMVSRAQGQLVRIKEEASEIADKAVNSTASLGSFGLAYYVRRRIQLKGKRVTFDKAGKFDVFLISGAALMIAGISPFLGEAGRVVANVGAGVASAGLVDTIDKIATDHHTS